MDIDGGVGGLVPFLEDHAHGHTGILSGDLEGTLDGVSRQPAKERTKQLIIGDLGVHKARGWSEGSIVNMEADPVGIIDNAIKPVVIKSSERGSARAS